MYIPLNLNTACHFLDDSVSVIPSLYLLADCPQESSDDSAALAHGQESASPLQKSQNLSSKNTLKHTHKLNSNYCE